MLQKVDRVLYRVTNLAGAVRHYRDKLGLKLLREDAHVAIFQLAGGEAELVLHDEEDLPGEATYFLVTDVHGLYTRRRELNLTFDGPPQRVRRGFRATVKDAFGVVMHVIDHKLADASSPHAGEDVRTSPSLFPGVPQKLTPQRDKLVAIYTSINRTADDLPYTPHFESLYEQYIADIPPPKPDRAEVWRHLLTVRKSGKLPKVGEARSKPPSLTPEQRTALTETLGKEIGRRDRLPYTARFEEIVDKFNATLRRRLSPHEIWRAVATLAK
jgi:catechol 2,3-dioxygenase-like lactoylglutathione lyase family enzyme